MFPRLILTLYYQFLAKVVELATDVDQYKILEGVILGGFYRLCGHSQSSRIVQSVSQTSWRSVRPRTMYSTDYGTDDQLIQFGSEKVQDTILEFLRINISNLACDLHSSSVCVHLLVPGCYHHLN